MLGRIIIIILGLGVGIAGFYLVVKWWDGDLWQHFLSGAMAAGGLAAAWGGIKGDTN